jgi:hypothetical protein
MVSSHIPIPISGISPQQFQSITEAKKGFEPAFNINLPGVIQFLNVYITRTPGKQKKITEQK